MDTYGEHICEIYREHIWNGFAQKKSHVAELLYKVPGEVEGTSS